MNFGTLFARGMSVLMLSGGLWAQPFLYHEAQDKKAQVGGIRRKADHKWRCL